MLKKIVAPMVLALSLAVAASGAAEAQTRVTLKSAKAGSSYYVMMVQLGELMKKESGGKIQPTVEESQGSVQNVKEAGRRPGNFLFTSPPNLLADARAAKKPFEGETGYDKIRTLFVMPFVTIHIVVQKDSGVTDVMQLAGKKFIAGGKGTFCERRTTRIFELLGLDGKVDVVDVELDAASNAMRNDKVAGFATCSSHPTPQLVELATTTPLVVLSFTDAQRKAILAADPLSGPLSIAAGTYKDQSQAVETVGVPVGAFTTTAMDDETAYFITRNFWQKRDQLAKENPWWGGVSPEMVNQLGTKLHPGALKYYKEAGIKVDDSLM
ncbi:MAG: TAXI family TRAP transporter solute-binding subunit [Alphaproteobacteria bacterium]|nr:TAXI family TRAP transporter solute-binding subunit [Alphaproteobacteria bacterium]MBU0796368.1 TAXI family TRAP transporter solute-binding subunit [Alphaproteobacteria bacterium]MBU0888599.1 TAXI family TRAP transporter solute-binding subunit [Alphaproteobacteria bacterium]MBU1813667.1 TAXI family TRAP transporter solute-binding subunit [Alphaproteobacteria bacterium]